MIACSAIILFICPAISEEILTEEKILHFDEDKDFSSKSTAERAFEFESGRRSTVPSAVRADNKYIYVKSTGMREIRRFNLDGTYSTTIKWTDPPEERKYNTTIRASNGNLYILYHDPECKKLLRIDPDGSEKSISLSKSYRELGSFDIFSGKLVSEKFGKIADLDDQKFNDIDRAWWTRKMVPVISKQGIGGGKSVDHLDDQVIQLKSREISLGLKKNGLDILHVQPLWVDSKGINYFLIVALDPKRRPWDFGCPKCTPLGQIGKRMYGYRMWVCGYSEDGNEDVSAELENVGGMNESVSISDNGDIYQIYRDAQPDRDGCSISVWRHSKP
jgi:hypothetical protein